MPPIIGELITIIIMAFALGMDAFSISLGMGMYKLRLRQVFKIGITIGIFHIFMPLFGMLAGRFLSDQFGAVAVYIGGGLLLILGVQMIWSSLANNEESLITPVGFGLILFALSVSLDSFSVGLTLGIYGAQTVIVLACFGAGATLLSWLGLMIGRRVQDWLGKYSEVLGGAILLFFGIKLLFPM
ncbi:manganese efflux pump MntP [Niallia endozanthoxylica]|uniref:Putative manganese efflux pump MntP n=1 Tax=Niallia endozanthoxylica TaxID=2036016 RepID=A0A5J5I030_9BACI|nr:manganese efflux pump MntP family protein [Niallia endozanthoxylica]KAA9027835.1 manganese efflux pump [Niallia endozanthoxylica]